MATKVAKDNIISWYKGSILWWLYKNIRKNDDKQDRL
jgi:hypothetical protein